MHRVKTTASLLLALALAPLAAAGEPEVRETAHYRIEVDAPGDPGAEELGLLLEAAWPQFQRFFGAKPRVAKGERLLVRIGAGDEASDYAPETKEAVARRRPGRAATRTEVLRVAARQFQYLLARTHNEPPLAPWYREGLVAHLARHEWDGRQLTLAASPAIAPDDAPAAALAAAGAPGFDLGAFVASVEPAASPELCFALFRFGATGNGGKPVKRFSEFCKKMDGGVAPEKEFARLVGKPEELQPQFTAWLGTVQQPWIQLFDEWEALAPDRFRGRAEGDSACLLKGSAKELKATLVVPKERGGWLAGGLLHYTSPEDYSVALLDWSGFLRIHRRIGKRWQPIEQGPGPEKAEDGNYHLLLMRKGEKVYFMVGAVAYGPWDLPGTALGFALRKGEIEFRDVAWKSD